MIISQPTPGSTGQWTKKSIFLEIFFLQAKHLHHLQRDASDLTTQYQHSQPQQFSTILNIVINSIYFYLQDEFCAAVDDLKTRERTSNEGIKEINYDCPETEQLYGIGYHKVIKMKHIGAIF